MARFSLPTVAALAVAAMTGFTHAEIATIELAARVSPVEITVGDLVRYEITVKHPAGARIELPAVRGNTGTFEVLAHETRTDSSLPDRHTLTHVLTLAAYETGEDTLPSQRVEVRLLPDTTLRVLYTPPTTLMVKATAPDDSGPLAEIYDDERHARGFPWALPLLLAVLAAGFWGLRTWRARRAAELARRPVPAPPAPTAAEVAQARLDALEHALPGDGEPDTARAFAFTLSEILREYLAARYGIDALEATTTELLERTANLPLSRIQHDWLRNACDRLDTVKFADAPLDRADARALLAEARTFVQETAPVPDAAPPTSREGSA